jgi:predicted RNase H-like nuclease (RuvC/YqgF family)
MYNDNLLEDVTQKKEIITKYEQAVRHDTIHTYYDESGKEITVSSLLDDNMRLMNKVSLLEMEISMYKTKLDAIKQLYGIEFVKEKNEYRIEAKQADSAKLLLPVFRDRLKYDSIKKQWSVTRRSVQIGDKIYPE